VSDRDERRGIDRSALVWGLLFTVVGLTYLLQALGVWDVRGEVLLPVLLIVAGGAVLATGFAGDRSGGGL
jgi:cytochrome c oxidase subunit IV